MNKKKLILIIIVLIIAIGAWFVWGTKNLGAYQKGEVIEIKIMNKVKICTNDLPFSIINSNNEVIKLKRSCSMTGRGQYCKNDKKVYQNITKLCDFSKEWCRRCSDAIMCGDQIINENFKWDQKEYVSVTKKCGDQTVTQEEKRQVSSGTYKVIVNGRVAKKFEIK